MYNGIPYAVIVNALLDGFGFKDGKVPEGVRNTTLYRLARQLRYICDFNASFVRSVIPDWGLSEEEIAETINSAIKSTRATVFPYELQQAIKGIEKPDLSTAAKRQEYLQRLNPLPKRMPFLFKYIYQRYGRNGRSALVASLPLLGTLLGRYESRYLDGRKHRPVFMVVVAGHAGSGKGFINDLQDWMLKPVFEADEEGRKQLEEYAREREKKKGAKQLPDKPTPCMRVLSATSIISEEIDESRRANKNGAWADKSDIFRKAYDGSVWGQDYLTYSGSVRIYTNLLFAGTYVSVKDYFSNVENGLMTRFFFTEMARDLGKNVELRAESDNKQDRKAYDLIQKLYDMGSTTTMEERDNVISFQLPKAKKEAYDFNDERIKEWEASGPDEEHRDNAIDLLRRRAAVVIFRASQIMYALEGGRETQQGAEMAKWFGNEAYLNQYIMFADALNDANRANEAIQKKQDIAAMRVAKNNHLFRVLDELPDDFNRDDFCKACKELGINTDTSNTYLSRMVNRELVMKTESGYRKIKFE